MLLFMFICGQDRAPVHVHLREVDGEAGVGAVASSAAATGTGVAAGGAAEVDTKHNRAAAVRKNVWSGNGWSIGMGVVATSGAAASVANAGVTADEAAVEPKRKGREHGGKKQRPAEERDVVVTASAVGAEAAAMGGAAKIQKREAAAVSRRSVIVAPWCYMEI